MTHIIFSSDSAANIIALIYLDISTLPEGRKKILINFTFLIDKKGNSSTCTALTSIIYILWSPAILLLKLTNYNVTF